MLIGDVLNKITSDAIDKDKGAANIDDGTDETKHGDGKAAFEDGGGASVKEDGTGGDQEDGTDDADSEEIELLRASIEALDERLNGFKTAKLGEDKRAAMEQANYSAEQIERHIQHVTGDDIESIKASVSELVADIKPLNVKTYVDPSLNNGASGKPRQNTADDYNNYGRKLVKDASKRTYGGRYYG